MEVQFKALRLANKIINVGICWGQDSSLQQTPRPRWGAWGFNDVQTLESIGVTLPFSGKNNEKDIESIWTWLMQPLQPFKLSYRMPPLVKDTRIVSVFAEIPVDPGGIIGCCSTLTGKPPQPRSQSHFPSFPLAFHLKMSPNFPWFYWDVHWCSFSICLGDAVVEDPPCTWPDIGWTLLEDDPVERSAETHEQFMVATTVYIKPIGYINRIQIGL